MHISFYLQDLFLLLPPLLPAPNHQLLPGDAACGMQMAAALGPAATILGKVFSMLSQAPVAAYVDSLELGQNSEQIRAKLAYTRGLLDNAQVSDVRHNPGLQDLLLELSKNADQAEDLLDELHYFKIHDKLHGTNYADRTSVV